MLQDREVAIDQFIKITAGGVKIADYDQIQAALVKRYKEVYGSDIDLANVTADGIFVNDLSLIINNILQSFKTLYSNLDVDTATGSYLEALCRLSNVNRLPATQSIAQLEITSTEDTLLNNGTIFVDSIGNEWIYEGNTIEIKASSSTSTLIKVVCSTYGAIVAKAGSITQTLEASYLIVNQNKDASIGRDMETDSQLRARRTQSNGAQGVTVLESLIGDLLEIDGMEDIEIKNNNTNEEKVTEDGTTMSPHSVYIITRQREGIEIPKQIIGEIISNKMTPGISTNESGVSDVTQKQEWLVVLDPNISWVNQKVYWKKAKPIYPVCTVTITPGIFFAESTINDIGEEIIKYLNGIKLSSLPDKNQMIITATYADPKFNGAGTYIVKDVNLGAISSNPNTYFDYNHFEYSISGSDIIITFTNNKGE